MIGAAVRLDGLFKSYGKQAVVSDVSLAIGAGQFFTLLGPSGSGKTTTLMMLAGFQEPDQGTIDIAGKDVTTLPAQHRNLGIVFQNYALFPHLSVAENIAFPLRVRKLPAAQIQERVAWALDVVRLQAFGERLPAQLSGGQQQRVALARAIVFHPPVVLMDEPLGALDKNLRFQMQVEIKEIQQRLGMTVVYVTHDQEEAMNMSDTIVIMNQGRIEQMGPPRQVYEAPATVFAGHFLGEANLIAGTIGDGSQITLPNGVSVRAARRIADPTVKSGGSHFVRPEKIILSDGKRSESGPGNSVDGRIMRVSFLGNVIRYGIDIGASAPLVVDTQNLPGKSHAAVGDAVIANWQPDDAVAFAHG